jgi:GT2 family glycosyltransferase
MNLSIIIVNYNVCELLLDCLSGIFRYKPESTEVIVVDNDSSDDSVQKVRELYPEVKLILNKENKGFPVANNQAIKTASGKYILLLNPDTVIKDKALDSLLSFMDTHNDVMLLAPKLLNTDGSVQFSIQPFISVWEIIAETFYLHRPLKWLKSYHRKPINGPLEVEALSGAAIMIRREVFDRIGLLDEELFWTEDMEFCYRAYRNGMKIIYHPGIEIIHHGSSSGKKNPEVMISNQILSKVRYFAKNHSKLEYALAWIFRFLHTIIRLILLSILSFFLPALKVKAKAYLFTLKRFIKGNY